MSKYRKKFSPPKITPEQSPKPVSRPINRIYFALGGLGAIITIFLTLITVYQNERDRHESNNTSNAQIIIQKTQVKIQEELLNMLHVIGTEQLKVDSGNILIQPTVNALSTQYALLKTTQEILQRRYESSSTLSPTTISPIIITSTTTPIKVHTPPTLTRVPTSPLPLFEVVFAFDISGSIRIDPYHDEYINTATQLLKTLFDANKNNRVGIITFGTEVKTFIPISPVQLDIISELKHVYDKYSDGSSIFDGLSFSYDLLIHNDFYDERNYAVKAIIIFTDGLNYLPGRNLDELNRNTLQIADLIKSDKIRIASIFFENDHSIGYDTHEFMRLIVSNNLLVTDPTKYDPMALLLALSK